MQRGEEYGGGGVYSAPPLPHDYPSLYGGSPPFGSAPPLAPMLAPSAPTYAAAAAAPSYNLGNSSASAFNSQQYVAPAFANSHHAENPSSGFADHTSSPSSYASAYPPLAPSYPAAGSPYDRSFEIGAGLPSTTSVDSSALQHRSQYGNSGHGAPPQPSAGYDSYGQGKGGYPSEGEQGYAGGQMYEQGRPPAYDKSGYDLSDLTHYGNGGRSERSYDREDFLDVYAYDGGGAEPYGARGTGSNSWAASGTANSGSSNYLGSFQKLTRATPKAEGGAESGGLQRFRVKLLPESSSGDSVKDVVCQIGLDGVRMVDPSSNRILRIYPLDTIAKWEVKEPSVFTFWAKSAVDIDQRVIQLKSSTYTTTDILDTLTAACVQLCEMVGKDGPNDKSSAAAAMGNNGEIKKGSVLDWVALRSRAAATEEKQHWVPDEAVTKCTNCDSDFGAFLRRHHCRNCGHIFCDRCTRGRIALSADEDSQPVRVCDRCLAEVTHRLENSGRVSSKVSAPQRSHEHLAKKLQEELERNNASRKPVLTSSSSGNGNSRTTSVLNCAKCGSITLVTGSNSRCSSCGADSGSLSSSNETGSSGFGSSAGPPHLWSKNASTPQKSGPELREVACPTCTVHLQVQVPAFGQETVECGVCQHPFLVHA